MAHSAAHPGRLIILQPARRGPSYQLQTFKGPALRVSSRLMYRSRSEVQTTSSVLHSKKGVSDMSDVTSKDIQSLRLDVNSLRADVAERVRSTAERGWSGAKVSAQTVVEEIEEHALIATLLALLAGIFIGLLIGSRR